MRRNLPPTFPLRLILIVSIALCFCGTVTIILAVLSVKNQTWGYNWGTGFWCGAITLAAGVCGIVSSHARDICSMKTFMIFAVFGGVTSLVMLALSAGGLDKESRMYTNTDKSEHMTLIVHAGCLGMSLLQLILFILADGVCIYYLFVEYKSTLFSLKTTPGNKPVPIPHRKRSRHRNNSNSSTAPIYRKSRSKHKDKKNKQKNTTQSENIDDLETPLRDNRNNLLTRSRLEALPNSSPDRDYGERNSFTTFGIRPVAEQVSLIVHPDEDVSTVRSESRASNRDENHYAQGLLFEPPIPIEEDEELPPYEAVDSNPYKVSNVVNSSDPVNSLWRNDTNFGGQENSNTLSPGELTKLCDHANNQPGRINTRSEIPHGRGETSSNQRPNDGITGNSSAGAEPVYAAVQPVRSRSADLLSEEPDLSAEDKSLHPQGVMVKDFARQNDRISPRTHRSQSFRITKPNREKRLERRNRALSAEIKLTKDQLLSQGEQQNFIKRTPSVDSSNAGLYADKRVMPTKFSLRTPVRQVGAPYIPSAIPIKSISSLPIFRPPQKPPRTHSVTIEDLKSDFDDNVTASVMNVSGVTDCVFSDEIKSNLTNYKDNEDTLLKKAYIDEVRNINEEEAVGNIHDEVIVVSGKIGEILEKKEAEIYPCETKEVTTTVVNSGMKLQESPVIRITTKPLSTTPISIVRPNTEERSGNSLSAKDSMTIPSSPVFKQISAESSEIKDDVKKVTPVPKARSSVKTAFSLNKSNGPDSKSDSIENATAFNDSSSVDETHKEEDTAHQNKLDKHDFSVLKVNLPPLKTLSAGSVSPSLRMLNRKNPKKELENTETESHEITNTVSEKTSISAADTPSISVSRSKSVEYKGARPKIIPRTTNSVKIKSNSSVLSKKNLVKGDDSPFGRRSETGTGGSAKTNPGEHPKQNKSVHKKPAVQKSFANIRSTENATNRQGFSVRNSTNFSPPSSSPVPNSTSSVPAPSGSLIGTGATGYSQGVLHLPQTQFSRHVSPVEGQSSGSNSTNNNLPVNVQNIGNQQNRNTDNLMISKFL